MGFDTTIKFTDVAIVLATPLGPVLAVQAQKWLERRREMNARRLTIFRTLMATRVASRSISAALVEALNAVPVEFYGPQNRELKKSMTHGNIISITSKQR